MATRLYPATKRPGQMYRHFLNGNWNPVSVGPTSPWATRSEMFEASISKADCGAKTGGNKYFTLDFAHHASAGTSAYVWLTPPFSGSGTTGGTFDLCMFVSCRWKTASSSTVDAHARYMLTITLLDQNMEGVGLLLTDYVDATDLSRNIAISGEYQRLTTPVSLAALSYSAGYRIMIELGFQVTSIPAHTDTYPPSDGCQIWFPNTGADSGDTDAVAGGQSITGIASWMEFSQNLTFTDLAVPSNTTSGAALSIPTTLPQTMTRQSTVGAAEVWYKWTCPADLVGTKVFLEMMASNYTATITVYRTAGLINVGAQTVQGLFAMWTPVAGTDYYIKIVPVGSSVQAANGGSLQVHMFWRQTPQTGDLYVGSGLLVSVWRGNGELVNIGYYGNVVTGFAIDYSKIELVNLNGGTHAKERILVAFHNFIDVSIYDLETLGWGDGEQNIDYFDNTSYGLSVSPNTHPAQVQVLADGTVYMAQFGNGYLHVEGESNLSAFANWAAMMDGVPNPAVRGYIRRANLTEAVNQPGATTAATGIVVTAEKYNPWVIGYDRSSNVLYFTSGSIYSYLHYSQNPNAGFDPNAALKVGRWNAITGQQLGDITVPGTINPWIGARGVEPINGLLLVAAGDRVVLMTTTGVLVREYLSNDDDEGYDLEAVKTDGASVWAIDEMNAKIFKWDFDTAALVASWDTWGFINTTAQLDIFSHVCECCVDTQLEISNAALYKIGVSKTITALGEPTREATTCAALYLAAIKETLRRFPWAFATKYASAVDNLTGYMQLVEGPGLHPAIDDWIYAYQYPVDCIDARRIVPKKGDGEGRDFDRDPIPFRVGMKWNADNAQNVKLIFTNEPDATLEYTAFMTCAKDFSDPLFLDAVSWLLASKIAPSMSRMPKMGFTCMEMFKLVCNEAKTVDRTEAQEPKPGEAEWIDAR